MNDELKEILDFKENADYKKLSCDEIAILKDYITNLQQENKKIQQQHLETINKLIETQIRIEKAVEYIKEHTFQEEIGFDNKKGKIHYGYFVECKAKDLLNILNGRSDE